MPYPYPPNTIILRGEWKVYQGFDGDLTYKAAEELIPGHLLESVKVGDELYWQKNSSATERPDVVVALNSPELNLTVDDPIPAGDTVKFGRPMVGAAVWLLVNTGETVDIGTLLQSAGDGTVMPASATTADANLVIFKSLENLGTTTELTRVRAERI